MVPVAAVGRTAVAVGDIANSNFVVGMTRGRLWIAVLGILLGGIVALNVWGLSLSASSSATAVKIDALESDNSVLRGRVARRLSNERIEQEAARLGLAIPAPNKVGYLSAGSKDAEQAAERLADGAIALAPLDQPEEIVDPALVDPALADPTAATIDPATGLPVSTETTTAPAIDPVTGAPIP